jgi:putative membrane protein insertion efficiency factor
MNAHHGSPTWAARAVTAPIRAYQRLISPLLGARCRFHPSCSEYAAQAILRHGPLRGIYLACRRVLRCHPWNPGGIDEVPEVFGLRAKDRTGTNGRKAAA